MPSSDCVWTILNLLSGHNEDSQLVLSDPVHNYEMLSSAELQILAFPLNHNRSLKKMLNKKASITDPCGTPKRILNHKLKQETGLTPWKSFTR